jgi:hypothetical protein
MDSLKGAIEPVENPDWLTENSDRQERWKEYFDGKHDLNEDPVLKHYQATEDECGALRRQTEVLLDNMLIEAERAKAGVLQEATATTDVETFTTWALPLIRKIWPRLFANQIVSVQPMKGPTGKAHTVDFVYGSSGGAYSSGTSIYGSPDYTYSDDPGEATEPKEINLTVSGTTLTAVAQKLKMLYSKEAEQDLSSQYGLNLDSEVVKMLGMEIEREINRKLILGVYNAATTNTLWDSTQPGSGGWANATPREFNESLFDALNDANKQIFDRVFVNGNFILCGSTFANRLRKLNGFRQLDQSPGNARVVSGPNLFGTLRDQFRVYIDPFFSADQAIVGHKSNNWMYTGYVYAPYIPLWITPLIHTTKLQPARGVMTRYATFAKNGDFYATVTVT